MYGNDKRSKLIAYSGVFVALIAVGGWISIPVPAIPFTLQTLFVLLAAVVMKRYSVIPVTLYVLLGTLGLPIFHNGTAGPGVLLGPTGGFFAGFIMMALIAGVLFEKEDLRFDILGITLGTVLLYTFGTLWFMISTGSELLGALIVCVLPFIIGDAIKGAVAEVIAVRIRKSAVNP